VQRFMSTFENSIRITSVGNRVAWNGEC
jgi:hypothetical protein